MPITLDGNGIIKNINFQHPSASATNLTLNADGSIGNVAISNIPGRNKIINGNFSIWQRGTSFATGTYTADRWKVFNVTSASRSTDVPSNQGFLYSLAFANTSATFPLIDQYVESVNSVDLVGKQVTLSFWAKNVSGTATIYIELFAPTTVDTFPSSNYIGGTPYNFGVPSSNWTKYIFTTNILPSTVANGLQVRIVRANESAASTLITGVQLESGTVATPFDFKSYSDQLRECQRYCFVLKAYGASGVARSATSGTVWANLPVTMRTAPSPPAIGSGTWNFVEAWVGAFTASNLVDDGGSVNQIALSFSGASGRTTGAAIRYTGSDLIYTAEL